MAEESLGTAAIYLTVDSTKMEAGVARAKAKLAGMGTEAEAQYNKMTAAQKRSAESLVKQIALLDKSKAERIAYNAQLRVGGALGDEIARKAMANAQAVNAVGAETAAQQTARLKQVAAAAMAEVEARRMAAAEQAAEAKAREASALATGKQATAGRAQVEIAALNSATVKAQMADYAMLGKILDGNVKDVSELAAAEATLDRLQATGAITTEELAAAFAVLNKVTDKNTAANVANAASRKGLNSRTQYELGVLAGEIASGNTSRIKRSIPALLNASGMTKLLMSPAGLGLAGITAAIAAVTVGMEKGVGEINAYTKALALTGDASGLSAQQLNALSASVADATGQTQHAIAAVMAEVAGTGKFGGAAVRNVAQLAASIDALGGNAKQTIDMMASFGDDPVKGAAKLNDAYHLLSASVVEQIRVLAEQGDTEAATALAEREAAKAATDRVTKLRGSLIGLPALAHDVGHAFAEMWDKIMDSGRQGLPTDPLARQLELDKGKLATLQRRLDGFQKASHSSDASVAGNAALWLRDNAAAMKNQIQILSARVDSEQAKNDLPGLMQKLGDETSRVNAAYQSSLPQEQQLAMRVTAAVKAHEDMLAKLKKLGASQEAINQENKNYLRELELFANQQKGLKAHTPSDGGSGGKTADDYLASAKDLLTKMTERNIAATMKETAADAKANAEAIQFANNLDAQLRTRQAQLDLQVASVGMGQKEAQQKAELLAIDEEYNRKVAQLDRDRANHPDRAADYAAELAALTTHHDAEIAQTKRYYAELDAAQADWKAGLEGGMQDWADSAGRAADQMRSFVGGAFDQMSDALGNFATTGKLDVKSMVASILSDFAKMEMRIAASKILTSILGYFTGGGGGGSAIDSNAIAAGNFSGPHAMGGVFPGPISPFAAGGIVDSPHLFKFAKGTGLMGEAGPEAIMPLKRGPDGKLGVASSGGGGVTVNQTINVESGGASDNTQTQGQQSDAVRQFTRRMKETAKQTILDEQRPGGSLWNMAHA